MKNIHFCVMVTVLFLAAAVALFGQTSQGRILGTVTDSSGAVLTGVKVTITNTATKVSQVATTTSSGDYVAPNVEAGTYTVSAEVTGFKKALTAPFTVNVSRDARVDLRLQPGAVNEIVEVSAQQTLVDTTETTLNGVISGRAITELPLQGRDFQNLLPLNPGVQRTPGGGFHSVTSNGNRPDDNNFYIDGADDNDVYYGETVINDAGIQGTPASILPIDSLQEFNTQESPSADYGRKPGVVVNMGLKSGTNDIHGTGYYFYRTAGFDARNYFNPRPSPVAALVLNQFGASLGGPIKKDKWFYFLNYEGIRDKVGNPGVVFSPVTVSLASRASQLPAGSVPADYSIVDAIAACQPNCNPLSVQLSKMLLPNIGFTALPTDPSAIDFDFNNRNRGDNLVAKTDFHLSERNVFSARFIYSNTNQTEEDAFPLRPQWLSTASPISQVFGVNWTRTLNARMINDARFSYSYFNEAIFPLDHNVNPTAYGLNTGVTNPNYYGFPRINPGSSIFNYMGGNSSWPLETKPTRTLNFGDTFSYNVGKHAVRFGGEYRYGSTNYLRAGYGRGRIDFSTLEDFFAGNVHRWRLLYGDAQRDVSLKSWGLFVQDDYRVWPRLTLNLGLRYDVTYPIKDSRNLLANYVPTSATGLVQVGHGISQPYPTNYNDVSPRVGVAWDMFGTGKTVVRAAGGIIYVQPSIRTFMFNGGGLNLNPSGLLGNGTLNTFLRVAPTGGQINWGLLNGTNQTIFPSASMAGNSCSLFDAAGYLNQCNVFAVDQHLRTPYVANWNFNIQQAIGSSSMLQVAYVANHGTKLYSVTDLNQVDPNSPLETSTDPAAPCIVNGYSPNCEGPGRPLNANCPVVQGGLGLGGPCFPGLGFFNFLGNHSSSNYNSLQVTFTKRYSHGLYILAGYTYGHAIDTATTNLAGVPPNSLNYSAERGNGDYDIRNRFTLSLSYVIPAIKTKWQLLEGWQVNSIAMLEGGLPYTLYDASDDISLTGELNDRWNMTGPVSNIHWSPVTSIPYISPSQFGTDSSGNVTGNSQCINAAGGAGSAAAQQLLNFGCFVSGSTVITPPVYATQGNMGRNIFRGAPFRNWDFSLSKTTRIRENLTLQLRAELFNILNHPNFDTTTMNTDLSTPNSVGTMVYTPDVGAANPVIGSGGSRHLQLGAKVIW